MPSIASISKLRLAICLTSSSANQQDSTCRGRFSSWDTSAFSGRQAEERAHSVSSSASLHLHCLDSHLRTEGEHACINRRLMSSSSCLCSRACFAGDRGPTPVN